AHGARAHRGAPTARVPARRADEPPLAVTRDRARGGARRVPGGGRRGEPRPVAAPPLGGARALVGRGMRQHREVDAIVVELPGPGRGLVQNSPARRVPSHGTELFGTRYAIDLVGVDDRGRSAAPSLRA